MNHNRPHNLSLRSSRFDFHWECLHIIMVGILGIAVGVVSLGLQVSQGIVSYYSAYREQGQEIDGCMVREFTNIKSTLQVVPGLVEQVATHTLNSKQRQSIMTGNDDSLKNFVHSSGQLSFKRSIRGVAKSCRSCQSLVLFSKQCPIFTISKMLWFSLTGLPIKVLFRKEGYSGAHLFSL